MFARFACDLLSFCVRNFPVKYETREPGKIVVERPSYDTPYLSHTSMTEMM